MAAWGPRRLKAPPVVVVKRLAKTCATVIGDDDSFVPAPGVDKTHQLPLSSLEQMAVRIGRRV